MSEETLSKFVELLLQSVITLAVPVITAFVVAWLRAKVQEVNAEIPGEVRWAIDVVASMVVEAAEQSGLTDEILNVAENKKAWAMQYGEELLRAQLGLYLDLDKLGQQFWNAVLSGLDAAIESKVYRMNNKERHTGLDPEQRPDK
jgi:hypothetical protein